jgi:hypothetical protein
MIKLTTTGNLATVIINDLGRIEFHHPVTDYPLSDEFTPNEIYESDDLQDAITNNYILLTDENDNPINSAEDSIVADIVNDEASGDNVVWSSNKIIDYTNYENADWDVTSVAEMLETVSNHIERLSGTGIHTEGDILTQTGPNEITIIAGRGCITYENFHREINWGAEIINPDVSDGEATYYIYIDQNENVITSTIYPDINQNILLGGYYYNGDVIAGVVNSGRNIYLLLNNLMEYIVRLGYFIYDGNGSLSTYLGNGKRIYSSACKVQVIVKGINLGEISSDDVGTKLFSWSRCPETDMLLNYNFINEGGTLNTYIYNDITSSNSVDLPGDCTFTNGSDSVTTSQDLTGILEIGNVVYFKSDTLVYERSITSINATTITLSGNYTGTGGTGVGTYNASIKPLASGKYVKHLVLRSTDDKMHIIYGQEEFDTEEDAIGGSLPIYSDSVKNNTLKIAAIVVQKEDTDVSGGILDLRPLPFAQASGGSGSGSGGGVSDHGGLSGLGDDDHIQYLLTNGSREVLDVLSYNSDKIFLDDNNIISKKYVDDQILSHLHTSDDITNFHDSVNSNFNVSQNTDHRNTTTGNPHQLDFSDLNGTLSHDDLTENGVNDHDQIDNHIADDTIHREINDSGSSNVDLWSAEKILNEIDYDNANWDTDSTNSILDRLTTYIEENSGSGRLNPVGIMQTDLNEVTVYANEGYISYSGVNKKISWPDTLIDTTTGYTEGSYYVYVDLNGVIQTSQTEPNRTHVIVVGSFYYGNSRVGIAFSCGCVYGDFKSRVMDYMMRNGVFIFDNGGSVSTYGTPQKAVISSACKVQFAALDLQLTSVSSADIGTRFLSFFKSNVDGWEIDYDFIYDKGGYIKTDIYNDLTGGMEITASSNCTFINGSVTVTTASDLTGEIEEGNYIYLTSDTQTMMGKVESINATTITLESNYRGTSATGATTIITAFKIYLQVNGRKVYY